MEKLHKKHFTFGMVLAILMAILFATPAFAGWEGGPGHWWWRNSDGSYPHDGAATIDGASRFRVFWSIVMPNVKPAWLTMIIFSVQGLWNNSAATVIYSEAKKTLVYALTQIQAGGIARTGQMAAAQVIIIAVPILIFVFSQSQILETMASSGIKD